MWIPLLVIGLVLVLAGGGTTAWFLTSGDAEAAKPAPPPALDPVLTGKVAWQLPEVEIGAEANFLRSWSSDDVVVGVAEGGITAWSTASGEKMWQIAPPAQPGGGMFCGASGSAVKGIGAVSYGARDLPGMSTDSCTGIMLVDLKTGQPRWNVPVPVPKGDLPPDSLRVDVAGDRVVYGYNARVTGLNVADGSEVWTYRDPECMIGSYKAEGGTVAFFRNCGGDEGSMRTLDSATGRVKGDASLPRGAYANVVSADPVVLSVQNPDASTPEGTYVVFDEQGNKRSSIAQQLDSGRLNAEPVGGYGRDQYRVVLSHGMLVTATKPRYSGASNEIVAFDLDTGKLRWSKSLGLDASSLPFAATEDGVLAINGGSPQVMRLSWKSGTIRTSTKPYSPLRLDASDYALHWGGDAVHGVNVAGMPLVSRAFALK